MTQNLDPIEYINPNNHRQQTTGEDIPGEFNKGPDSSRGIIRTPVSIISEMQRGKIESENREMDHLLSIRNHQQKGYHGPTNKT